MVHVYFERRKNMAIRFGFFLSLRSLCLSSAALSAANLNCANASSQLDRAAGYNYEKMCNVIDTIDEYELDIIGKNSDKSLIFPGPIKEGYKIPEFFIYSRSGIEIKYSEDGLALKIIDSRISHENLPKQIQTKLQTEAGIKDEFDVLDGTRTENLSHFDCDSESLDVFYKDKIVTAVRYVNNFTGD